MLKTRIIPTLLWKDLTLVKGVSFDSWRRVGSIMPAVKVYNTRQVDELIVLDIMASNDNKEPDYETIQDFSAECFVPLTFGGGVSSVEVMRKLLRAGADKIAINTSIYIKPEIIVEGVKQFGKQCITASIDVKRENDNFICYSNSGNKSTGKELLDVVQYVCELGVGEVLITSIDLDGTMKGYDIEMLKLVSESVEVPVIASGGAGNYQHMHEALRFGGASAVAASSIFHFTEQTPLEAKKYLKKKGIPVRI